MSLDKDQLHALLADYVEGSLSEQQIDEAEAYLNANPGVRSVVDKLMIDSEALRALPPVRSPVDYSEEVRVSAERDLLLSDASDSRGRRPFSGPMLALAAMLLVGLGLGGAAYWMLAHRPATDFEFASTASTPAAATRPAVEARGEAPGEVAALAMPHPAAAPAAPMPAASAESALADLGTRTARDGVADHAAMAAESPEVVSNVLPPFPSDAAAGGAADVAAQREQNAAERTVAATWPPELERPAIVPPSVQAIVDAAPVEGGRRAIAVVVGDVAAIDAMRRLVRDHVGLEQQSQNVYETVNNARVLAATLPVDLGPLVATDVPAEVERRLRAAVAVDGAATIYEVSPARAPASDAPVPTSQPAGPLTQEASTASLKSATSRPANVDVFVVLVPSTLPTTAPATSPAE